MQTPSTATLPPIARPRAVAGASILMRSPSRSFLHETTVPISLMMPVNISAPPRHAGTHEQIGSQRLHRHLTQYDRLAKRGDAPAANHRDRVASAEYQGRDEQRLSLIHISEPTRLLS